MAHKYQTDVLELRLDATTTNLASRATLTSFLYAVLEGASELLEISRDDVDGALHQSFTGVTAIALFDVVPGGAGHVGRIAEALDEVLREAHRKVETCECGRETSCYRCLRVFRNERFHDDLSRGAASDLLRRLLGGGTLTAGLARYALTALEDVGRPGERFLLLEAPTEVFERAQPGQIDLYDGRLCVVEVDGARRLGAMTLDEAGFELTTPGGPPLTGPVESLRLLAAAV